jgi:deazaflavin-dependent oxidoreductase (nitroreductase family)
MFDADAMKAFNKSIVDEFRANEGKVGGPFEGATLLLLTSTGADTNPDWVHNLRANPRAHVEVGTEAYDVTARELPPEERDEVFAKVVAAAVGFGDYQEKTSRVIPLFELRRS